jgi:hypothetical protein
MNTQSLIVLIAALATPAGAQEPGEKPDTYFPQQLSTRDLLTACASSSLTATGRLRQRYCLGFVSGVEEVVRLQQLPDPSKDRSLFCVPAGTTARALADVVVRHSSSPSVDLERPSASIVLEALAKGYPCADHAEADGKSALHGGR